MKGIEPVSLRYLYSFGLACVNNDETEGNVFSNGFIYNRPLHLPLKHSSSSQAQIHRDDSRLAAVIIKPPLSRAPYEGNNIQIHVLRIVAKEMM